MMIVLLLDLFGGCINVHHMAVQFQNFVLTYFLVFSSKFSQLTSYRNNLKCSQSLHVCMFLYAHVSMEKAYSYSDESAKGIKHMFFE